MSTPFPILVGTTYRDRFFLKDPISGAPTTGKTDSSFTKRVSRGTTGNVSTTGIVITEIDATNNAGWYDIQASGSTGFPATAGCYSVAVELTSDPDRNRFEQTVLVTSDGDFSGTAGAASFTATASNGRITDGTNPLSGVTVRLRNAQNTIVSQLTSDASGLYGPVYLDATVTIDAQRSGYSVNNSNQITVVGSTATGPGTDVALTAVTSSSNILNSDLLAYARVQARDAAGSEADTVLQQCVNSAMWWIATAKFWNYYKTYGDFTLREPYSTGTLTLTNGSTTVTLSVAGTWPSWAASGKLKIGNKVYRIASRTSNSVVVLATAWAEDSESGTSFILFQDEYSLASDCLKFGKPFPGSAWGTISDTSSFEEVLSAQNSMILGEAYPRMYAVHASGGTAKIIFWPYPSSTEDVQLAYWYYRRPAALASASDVADVDPLCLELLHRSLDYQVAVRYESCVAGDPEKCFKRLMECFARFASNDKGPMNPTGPLGSFRLTGPLNPRLGG